MKSLLYIFSFSFLVVMSWSSCTKLRCENGYELENDICVCPKGKYEDFGKCRELESNEYYGIANCIYKDTIFVKFEKDTNMALYKIRVKQDDWGKEFELPYIEKQGYDSIAPYNYISIFRPRYTVYPKFLRCIIYGKIYSNYFSGIIQWYEGLGSEVVIEEECPFWMER